MMCDLVDYAFAFALFSMGLMVLAIGLVIVSKIWRDGV